MCFRYGTMASTPPREGQASPCRRSTVGLASAIRRALVHHAAALEEADAAEAVLVQAAEVEPPDSEAAPQTPRLVA
jgi:hypothetical protein